ncbi:MAG: O-antigen ligase family protein, partial [Thermodesulfobacteriota bacterium]
LTAPLLMDVNLFYQEVPGVRRPINGFPISIFDIPFLTLIGLWFLRLSVNQWAKVRFFPNFTIPYLAWTFLVLLSLASAGNVPSLVGVAVIWSMFKNWLIFLFLANNVNDQKTLFLAIGLFLLGGLFQSGIGLLQLVAGSDLSLGILGENARRAVFVMRSGAGAVSRVSGTMGHPNQLAIFLGPLIPVAFALLLVPGWYRGKGILVVILLGTVLGHLLTYSRGGYLSLAFAMLITASWCLAKRIKRPVASVVIVAATAVVLAVMVLAAVSSVRQRLFEEDYGAAYLRLPLSQVALNMIRYHPWLGVGPTNFVAVGHSYDLTPMAVTWEFPAPVHNELLLIASETGLPAFILFMYIYIWRQIILARAAMVSTTPRLA